MTKKEKQKLINEMKEIVMDIHRYAGKLDAAIQALEFESEIDNPNQDDWRILVRYQKQYCEDYYKLMQLTKREEEIWSKLTD